MEDVEYPVHTHEFESSPNLFRHAAELQVTPFVAHLPQAREHRSQS
jgi:hypothetical protein